MIQRRRLMACASAAAVPRALVAQDKPLRVLVGFPAGGSVDIIARVLAERLREDLRRTTVVDNKPGAAGRVAAELLKNAAGDPDWLMVCPIVVPVLAPLVFSKLNYNPTSDFTAVGHIASTYFALAASVDAPYKTFAEMLAWMRANPSRAAIGNPGAGSLPHFFGLMIGSEAKVDVVAVPFQGGAPQIAAISGNQIAAGIDVVGEVVKLHQGGRIRMLAISAPARDAQVPDVPTFRELGYPNIQAQSWFGLYAPARLAAQTVQDYNAALNRALTHPAMSERLKALSLEAGGGSAADLVRLQEAETARWSPIIKASGFKAD